MTKRWSGKLTTYGQLLRDGYSLTVQKEVRGITQAWTQSPEGELYEVTEIVGHLNDLHRMQDALEPEQRLRCVLWHPGLPKSDIPSMLASRSPLMRVEVLAADHLGPCGLYELGSWCNERCLRTSPYMMHQQSLDSIERYWMGLAGCVGAYEVDPYLDHPVVYGSLNQDFVGYRMCNHQLDPGEVNGPSDYLDMEIIARYRSKGLYDKYPHTHLHLKHEATEAIVVAGMGLVYMQADYVEYLHGSTAKVIYRYKEGDKLLYARLLQIVGEKFEKVNEQGLYVR